MRPTVLVVQPEPGIREWIAQSVVADGLHAMSYGTAAEWNVCQDQQVPACAILPALLTEDSVLRLHRMLAGRGVAVLYVALSRDIESCVRAMRAGALDYLTWPCDVAKLRATVRQAIDLSSVASASVKHRNSLLRRLETLTPREREVFALVSAGMMNKLVAQQLEITEITVQVHRGRVMRKMQAKSFADLVRMSDSLGVSRDGATHRSAPATQQAEHGWQAFRAFREASPSQSVTA